MHTKTKPFLPRVISKTTRMKDVMMEKRTRKNSRMTPSRSRSTTAFSSGKTSHKLSHKTPQLPLDKAVVVSRIVWVQQSDVEMICKKSYGSLRLRVTSRANFKLV